MRKASEKTKWFLCSLFVVIIMYLAGSFNNTTFNIKHWGEASLGIISVIGSIILTVGVIIQAFDNWLSQN